MHYRQYRAAFISSKEPLDEGEVSTLEELLALPFVSKWAKAPTFHRLSVSEGARLMVEMQSGKAFWVIAHVTHPLPELPAWAGPQQETRHDA